MSRTIIHADMDAFFAAVEARENPAIAREPIVVGADPQHGRGRGVVAACNYPARRYGLHSAMPISEAYRRCPHAVFLRPRIHLYAAVSQRLISLLHRYSDLVEKLSIDEAFLDVTASTSLFGDGATIARCIKTDVWEKERLTVSVGVAPNKFLAKLASDLQKPDSLVVVEPGSERRFLDPLPVERLWGVGKKTAHHLHELGILTICDIARTPIQQLQQQFGPRRAAHLYHLSLGHDDRPVLPAREPKQVSRETTFPSDTDDRDLVRRTLLGLCEDVASRLRHRRLAGRTVSLKLRLAPFQTLSRQQTTDTPLDTTDSIYPIALDLLANADPGDRPIRLVGVGISGFRSHDPQTRIPLFDDSARRPHDRRVADLMDQLSEQFGRNAVRRARLLHGEEEKA